MAACGQQTHVQAEVRASAGTCTSVGRQHPPTSSISVVSSCLCGLSAPDSSPMSASRVWRQILSDMVLAGGKWGRQAARLGQAAVSGGSGGGGGQSSRPADRLCITRQPCRPCCGAQAGHRGAPAAAVAAPAVSRTRGSQQCNRAAFGLRRGCPAQKPCCPALALRRCRLWWRRVAVDVRWGLGFACRVQR